MVGWHFVFLLVHIVTVTTELKSMSSLSSFKHMLKESMLLMWLLLLKSLLLLPWIIIVCQFYAFGGRIFVWCKFTVHFSFCPIPCVCLCFVYLLYAFVCLCFVCLCLHSEKEYLYLFPFECFRQHWRRQYHHHRLGAKFKRAFRFFVCF